jgi:hypothetical protein
LENIETILEIAFNLTPTTHLNILGVLICPEGTKGTWTLTDDTVYFQMVPIYDTLSQTNVNDIISDTLILSTDRIPERFTQKEFAAMLLSSGGQNRMAYPDKLLFRKGRLYKMQDGKLVLKKRRGFWSGKKGKKWVPWYFKTEE